MDCGQTCDGLYRFAFCLVNFGTKSTLAVKLSVSAIIYLRWTATLHMCFYQRIYAVLMELCWARTDPKVVLDWVRDVVNPITIWRIIYALWRLKTIVMLMLRFFCRRVYMLIGRVQKVILPSKINIK